MSDKPDLLTVPEIARLVGCSTRTVYRALRSGALAGEKKHVWKIWPRYVWRPPVGGNTRLQCNLKWFARRSDVLDWRRP